MEKVTFHALWDSLAFSFRGALGSIRLFLDGQGFFGQGSEVPNALGYTVNMNVSYSPLETSHLVEKWLRGASCRSLSPVTPA